MDSPAFAALVETLDQAQHQIEQVAEDIKSGDLPVTHHNTGELTQAVNNLGMQAGVLFVLIQEKRNEIAKWN
jgi:hypothetical protein